MGKRELKERYPEYNISIIDILAAADPTKTKKFLPLLIKELKNDSLGERMVNDTSFMSHVRYRIDHTQRVVDFTDETIMAMPDNISLYLSEIPNSIANNCNLPAPIKDILTRFEELCAKNLIKDRDIQNYENLAALAQAVSDGDFAESVKNNTYRTQVILDNDDWLIIRPLTYEASVKYGYGTKWCVSMVSSKEYFYRYTRDNYLVFVFNKTNKTKFGIQGNTNFNRDGSKTTSVVIFNEADSNVDSYFAGFTREVMSILLDNNIMYDSNLEYLREFDSEAYLAVMDFYENALVDKCLAAEQELVNHAIPRENAEPRIVRGDAREDVSEDVSEDVPFDFLAELDTLLNEIRKTKRFDLFKIFRKQSHLLIFYIPINWVDEFKKVAKNYREDIEKSGASVIFLLTNDNQIKYEVAY